MSMELVRAALTAEEGAMIGQAKEANGLEGIFMHAIGGTPLGLLRGDELEALAASEQAKAEECYRNARRLGRLRALRVRAEKPDEEKTSGPGGEK